MENTEPQPRPPDCAGWRGAIALRGIQRLLAPGLRSSVVGLDRAVQVRLGKFQLLRHPPALVAAAGGREQTGPRVDPPRDPERSSHAFHRTLSRMFVPRDTVPGPAAPPHCRPPLEYADWR